MSKLVIIGAGVGGLSAACWRKFWNKDSIIIESQDSIPRNLHNGVHYLHEIPELPFDFEAKRITLTDGIMSPNGKIKHEADLNDALDYSEKVREIQHPSSILNVGKRKFAYITKTNNLNDLINDMVDYLGADTEIFFNEKVEKIDIKNKKIKTNKQEIEYSNLITTIPLDVFSKISGLEIEEKLESNKIYVSNFEVNKIVPNWVINAYIPSKMVKAYRFSVLNGILSAESVDKMDNADKDMFKNFVKGSFHIGDSLGDYDWKTGKVISISMDERARILEKLISNHIFPIGRFALWNRKLLIDSTIEQAKETIKGIEEMNYPGRNRKKVIDKLISKLS